MSKDNIISVDDFGVNERANTAILNLLRREKIDRIGVMIYGKISSQDIETLRQGMIKIDLHLEIPILHKKKKMHGSVIGRGVRFLFLLSTGHLSTKDLYNEWERQIQLFHEKFGRMPDGLNSHENIHLFPAFFTVACTLATRHHIPFVRCGKDGIAPAHNVTRMILHMLAKKDRRILKDFPHITTSSYLASMDWFMCDDKKRSIFPKNTEVICHPERTEEYAVLKNI